MLMDIGADQGRTREIRSYAGTGCGGAQCQQADDLELGERKNVS